ncbi:hypothetical protein CRG98_005472 [Punica granatum]|uniref:Uncharacterized protein n=1 Tax=Punica granatum TaxID=22663 RepID=A0A2I0L0L3_PUNGR|nr:hypothetical protein CRG98_005472 [Punica granatum]
MHPMQLYFSTQGSVPFGSIPTTFLHQGSVPFGSIPTTFLHRGQSLSGQSQLLFCTGVSPLRVNPDYFSALGSVPFGSIPTTLLHRGQSPSGQSRLLFCTGVSPLRVTPDYFSAQGSVPFESDPTLISAQGSVPFGVNLDINLCTGVSPLRANPDFKCLSQFCSGLYTSILRISLYLLFIRYNIPHIQSKKEKLLSEVPYRSLLLNWGASEVFGCILYSSTQSKRGKLSAPHFGSPFQTMISTMVQATT